ncbi:MAG: sll1863 family stress response protein [Planctomycetota bacterium]|jgi:hypothetical protein
MEEREAFIEKMQRSFDELQVKAHLAKLEMGDVRDELQKEYDHLQDRLRDLREETEDEWWAVKGGFVSSWEAFKERFTRAFPR